MYICHNYNVMAILHKIICAFACTDPTMYFTPLVLNCLVCHGVGSKKIGQKTLQATDTQQCIPELERKKPK